LAIGTGDNLIKMFQFHFVTAYVKLYIS